VWWRRRFRIDLGFDDQGFAPRAGIFNDRVAGRVVWVNHLSDEIAVFDRATGVAGRFERAP